MSVSAQFLASLFTVNGGVGLLWFARLLFVLGTVGGFFSHLYGQLLLFAVAMATFFFAWAALLFAASGISGSERTRAHAIAALYAALGGLALALLAGTFAGIVNISASGQ